MPDPFLLISLGLTALVNWVGNAREVRVLEWVTKPLFPLLLLGWTLNRVSGSPFLGLFAMGLTASLIGDILLMLPGRYFAAAGGFFLMTHLVYGVGFLLPFSADRLVSLIITAGILIGAFWGAWNRMKGVVDLKKGVSVLLGSYMVGMSFHLGCAVSTFFSPQWLPAHSLAAAVGAALFFLSDSLIAWHRYMTPIPNRNLKVMITYHAGQAAIIFTAGLHFAA